MRKNNRHPGAGGVPRPGEHYGVPLRPYVRGAAKPLVLCERCDCWHRAGADCPTKKK